MKKFLTRKNAFFFFLGFIAPVSIYLIYFFAYEIHHLKDSGKHTTKSSPSSEVAKDAAPSNMSPINLSADQKSANINLMINGKKSKSAEIKYDNDAGQLQISITNKDKTSGILLDDIWHIENISKVKVASDKTENIFVAASSGGTGIQNTDLYLIDPDTANIIGTKMAFSSNQRKVIPEIVKTANFNSPELSDQKAFLEKVKYDYGCIDQELIRKDSQNPKYIYYFWAKDNPSIQNKHLKIKKYPGQPPFQNSVIEKIEQPEKTFYAYFKAGIIAYDKKAKEYFALYHPQDHYSWGEKLYYKNQWLIIVTRYEGIVAIETQTNWITSFESDKHKLNNNELDSIISQAQRRFHK